MPFLSFFLTNEPVRPIGPKVALPGAFGEPSTVVSGRDCYLSFRAARIGIHYISTNWTLCEKTCLKIEGLATPSKNKRLPSAQLFGDHFFPAEFGSYGIFQFWRLQKVSNLVNSPVASSDSHEQRCCHDRLFFGFRSFSSAMDEHLFRIPGI